MKEKKPTASTRSNEDFPAFWSPIIVTSISVALHLPDHHMALFLAHLKPQLFFFFPSSNHTESGDSAGNGPGNGRLFYLRAQTTPRQIGPLTRTSSKASHKWYERFQPWRWFISEKARARSRQKQGRIYMFLTAVCRCASYLSGARRTRKNVAVAGGKQIRSTSRSKPRISSQYANEEESVLSQNDLDMVSTSGPNKQQEFCNQHAQVGFLGGMLRDEEKKRRDPRDIKALVRAGIV